MDLYSFITVRNLVDRMTSSIIENAIAELPGKVSNISWMD